MGIRIDSLMHAAHAAGFAMAPEDMYAAEDLVEQPVAMRPSRSTELVAFNATRPNIGIMAHARALASRYGTTAWLMPRLPA